MARVFETRVIDIIPRAPGVRSFRFASPERAIFRPGQYFVLTVTRGGKELTKHFSFSNSPTEQGYVEFTKKLTEHEFSLALRDLRVGDPVVIDMPYGFFTFEGEYDKIACLSGGIGITAIRSICRYACDKKLPSDIVLLYANKTEEDIVFRDDLTAMAEENPNFTVIHTLTQPANSAAWSGRVGRIDAAMIKAAIPDYFERVFFICGPPGMVDSLRSMLKDDLNVPPGRIRWEHFLGYL